VLKAFQVASTKLSRGHSFFGVFILAFPYPAFFSSPYGFLFPSFRSRFYPIFHLLPFPLLFFQILLNGQKKFKGTPFCPSLLPPPPFFFLDSWFFRKLFSFLPFGRNFQDASFPSLVFRLLLFSRKLFFMALLLLPFPLATDGLNFGLFFPRNFPLTQLSLFSLFLFSPLRKPSPF